ncbi:MAG: hypothetical protein E7358_02955 [Clostridiales bacterium]|jgi:predicted dehydrogenase|nr:hypothetical protein [Clostridiales bacterium]
MKTIGFIDCFLDNFHANKYVQWIKEYNEKNGTDFVVKYAWAEEDLEGGKTNDEWCTLNEVTRCATIAEVCEKSDFLMILAPSRPDTHLRYCEEAFKFGKLTYVDKTFAPDFATAKKIFELAEKYNVKFFSSSALRYAKELEKCNPNPDVMTVMGGGNFDEYIIHCIEIAVKFMGCGASKVRYEKYFDQEWADIVYENGKLVKINLTLYNDYFLIAPDKDGISKMVPMGWDFFVNLLGDILRFFETGEVSFDVNQTLEVIKIREALISGKETPGQWKNL